MVDADDVNIFEGSLRTVKENIKSVVFVSKETGIEVNAYETKYMVKSRDQNAGRSHNIKLIILPLKGWKSSNIWEQTEQIKILFRKK